MSTAKNRDVYEKIKEFQHQTLLKKPDRKNMIHEVRMMNFKIHPLSGSVADLDFGNEEFIDALWSLGKLDEFFRTEFTNVSHEEQEAFFRLVDELRLNFQQQLNSANIASVDFSEATRRLFEVEIIKDNLHPVN